MFQNNNKEVINKLSNKISKNNKGRNFIIKLAFILISSLLTIGLTTWFTSIKTLENIEGRKTEYYGYKPWDLSIKEEETTKIIERILIYENKINEIEVNTNESFIDNNLILKTVKDNNYYKDKKINIIQGSYPKRQDEIIVPSWLYKKLNEPILDKPIMIRTFYDHFRDLVIYEDNIESFNYKLTGVYEAREEDSGEIFIGVAEVSYYSIYIISIAILLIILSGYLLLYNIFYIHVIKEFKYYGMLRVLGMRKSDIHKIIYIQGFKLSIIPIFIGMYIGHSIGNIITPMLMKLVSNKDILEVSNSPKIYIITLILSFITIYLSTVKPSKIASEIKLTEALKADSLLEVPERLVGDRKSTRCRIENIAFKNIFRNKKKTLLTFSSLGLSSIVFIVSLNGYFHLDSNVLKEGVITSDVRIYHSSLIEKNTRFNSIPIELINELKETKYIKDLNIGYEVILPINKNYNRYGAILANEGIIKDEFSVYYDSSINQYINYKFPRMKFNKELYRPARIQGKSTDAIVDDLTKYYNIKGIINEDKYDEGNYIIALDTNSLSIGQKIELNFIVEGNDGILNSIKREFEVMALGQNNSLKRGIVSELDKTFIINDNTFKEIYGDNPIYYSELAISLDNDINIIEKIKDICKITDKYTNDQLRIESKTLQKENLNNLQSILLRISIIISIIVGLIGFLNLFNSVVTGLLSRKHEFYIFKTIGMTNSQIKEMIFLEGLYNSLLSTVVVILSGYLSVLIIQNLLPFNIYVNKTATIASVIIVIILMALINIVMPMVGYKYISKDSLFKNLKEENWI